MFMYDRTNSVFYVYLKCAKHVIPEYVSNGTTPSSGEIYRVNPDGTEEAVAYYDPKEKVFSLYD